MNYGSRFFRLLAALDKNVRAPKNLSCALFELCAQSAVDLGDERVQLGHGLGLPF